MSLIITLIVIGIILLAIEVLIVPGFGIPGILGLLSLIGAAILGFTMFDKTTGLIILGSIIVATSVSTWLILRSKTWKMATLHEKITSKSDSLPSEKGISEGTTGITISRLAPMGKARFGEVDTEVSSIQGIIDRGCQVEVVSTDDGKIIVKQSNN
jgi:membrane-bound ClpP family serine protease